MSVILTSFNLLHAYVCADKCRPVDASLCLVWIRCMLVLHIDAMSCMCVAYIASEAASLPQSVSVCMLVVYVAVCICMCFFAASSQYKRGHRKTASFGTILDVPKIVITGTT